MVRLKWRLLIRMHTLSIQQNLKHGRKKPWGTTHAILSAKDHISDPFIVINADDCHGQDSFAESVDAMKQLNDNEYLIMGYELVNTLSESWNREQRCLQSKDGSMYLTGIKETLAIGKDGDKIHYAEEGQEHILDPKTYVSMNFWGFPQSVLPEFEAKFIDFVKENSDDPKSEVFYSCGGR